MDFLHYIDQKCSVKTGLYVTNGLLFNFIKSVIIIFSEYFSE